MRRQTAGGSDLAARLINSSQDTEADCGKNGSMLWAGQIPAEDNPPCHIDNRKAGASLAPEARQYQ